MHLHRSYTTMEQVPVGKREHFNSEDTASVKAQIEAASVSILDGEGLFGRKRPLCRLLQKSTSSQPTTSNVHIFHPSPSRSPSGQPGREGWRRPQGDIQGSREAKWLQRNLQEAGKVIDMFLLCHSFHVRSSEPRNKLLRP